MSAAQHTYKTTAAELLQNPCPRCLNVKSKTTTETAVTCVTHKNSNSACENTVIKTKRTICHFTWHNTYKNTLKLDQR